MYKDNTATIQALKRE